MKLAAGIMLQAPTGAVLFLKRGVAGDFPGAWCFPGGHVESGETLDDTAVRETLEETGYRVGHAGKFLTRQISGVPGPGVSVNMDPATGMPLDPPPPPAVGIMGEPVDFTTFHRLVDEEFTPVLSDEHTAWAWAKPDDPPIPLHPGCQIALERGGMDELGLAQAIATGRLTSPQFLHNMWLFAFRITGTGIAYRRALNEFVLRKPEDYLTARFLQRCAGLPIILMHPGSTTLNAKEFSDRIVGSMLWTYIVADEVWGVGRIYDPEVADVLSSEKISTSPAVAFVDPSVNAKYGLEDGSKLLVEGSSSVMDHLAIVPLGVWDKGEAPAGVRADSQPQEQKMAESEKEVKEREDKARKDAEEKEAKEKADRAKADADTGTKLDKMLSFCDSMTKFTDSIGKRMDAVEAFMKKGDAADDPEKMAADKARKDAEESKEKEEKEKADRMRKDAEEKAEKEKADAEKTETAKRIADLEARMKGDQVTDAEHRELADAQSRADDVFALFGKSASRPMPGEKPLAYRKRMLRDLKVHSADWKDIDTDALPADAFPRVEGKVFADAQMAARNPVDLAPGELREVTKVDPVNGRRITEFFGKRTFLDGMKGDHANYVVAWNLNRGADAANQ